MHMINSFFIGFFNTIQKMNISEKFIRWIKFLFRSVSTIIKLNDNHDKKFKI